MWSRGTGSWTSYPGAGRMSLYFCQIKEGLSELTNQIFLSNISLCEENIFHSLNLCSVALFVVGTVHLKMLQRNGQREKLNLTSMMKKKINSLEFQEDLLFLMVLVHLACP